MEVVIRSANDSDAQAAFKLIAELGYADLSFARFTQTYRSVLENPAMMTFIAEVNGDVVGLATVSFRPQLRLAADLFSIDEFVIADSVRGQGVGRRFLEHLKCVANQAGAGRLELETNRARASYQRGFYVKNGFNEVDSAVMRIDYDLAQKQS
jgi:N-acetylglutamate synthase-like GNAT family acetyltransferase